MVEKAINAEAKAGLRPPSMIHEMHQSCPRRNCPAHTVVAKSPAQQRSSTWDPRDEPSTPSEKPQAQDESKLSRSSHSHPSGFENVWRDLRQEITEGKEGTTPSRPRAGWNSGSQLIVSIPLARLDLARPAKLAMAGVART